MRWFLPDAETRIARARRLFDVMLRRVHLGRDYCYTTNGVVGGALWVPPGTWRLGVVDQVVLLPGMVRVFGRGLARAQRGLTVMESGHPTHAPLLPRLARRRAPVAGARAWAPR